MTSAKQQMASLSQNSVQAFLRERYESREAPFDYELVRLESIMECLPRADAQRNARAEALKFLAEIGAGKLPRDTNRRTGPA
jgi:hypothetical protein